MLMLIIIHDITTSKGCAILRKKMNYIYFINHGKKCIKCIYII